MCTPGVGDIIWNAKRKLFIFSSASMSRALKQALRDDPKLKPPSPKAKLPTFQKSQLKDASDLTSKLSPQFRTSSWYGAKKVYKRPKPVMSDSRKERARSRQYKKALSKPNNFSNEQYDFLSTVGQSSFEQFYHSRITAKTNQVAAREHYRLSQTVSSLDRQLIETEERFERTIPTSRTQAPGKSTGLIAREENEYMVMPGSPAPSVPLTIRTSITRDTAESNVEFNSDDEIDNEIDGWMRMYRRELMLEAKVRILQAHFRMYVPLNKYNKWKKRRCEAKRKIFRAWLFVNAAERQNRVVKERRYFNIWQIWAVRRIAKNKRTKETFQTMASSDAGVTSLSAFSGVFSRSPKASKAHKKNADMTEMERIREATELKMVLLMLKTYFELWKKFLRDLVLFLCTHKAPIQSHATFGTHLLIHTLINTQGTSPCGGRTSSA